MREQTAALPSPGIRAGHPRPLAQRRVRTGPAPHRTSPRSMSAFTPSSPTWSAHRRNSSLRTARWRGRRPHRVGAPLARQDGARTARCGCPPVRRLGAGLHYNHLRTTTRTPPATRAPTRSSATRSQSPHLCGHPYDEIDPLGLSPCTETRTGAEPGEIFLYRAVQARSLPQLLKTRRSRTSWHRDQVLLDQHRGRPPLRQGRLPRVQGRGAVYAGQGCHPRT